MHLWHTSDSSFRLMKRNMSCQKLFSPVKKIVAGSRALILHPVRHNNWRIRLFFWWILCILSFVALSSITTPSFAAPVGWAAIYGEVNAETAQTIRQTSDGGYIVAGETKSFDTAGKEIIDSLVLKLGSDGTVEWQKSYGGAGWDWANSLQQTDDGGYIVAGMTLSFGAGSRDFWVFKLRHDGTVEWQKTYGGDDWDEAISIQQTSDKGYIVAGMTGSFGAGEFDFLVLKLRPNGTVEWQKTYGGIKEEQARSIQQTSDGGYIVAGMTRSFGAGAYDFLVLKLRPNGTVEWQKTYGGDIEDWSASIRQTSDGGYIVAGMTTSFNTGGGDAWVLKLRPDGTVEWQKTYGGSDADWAFSIQQTSDGGYITAGWTTSFNAEDKEIRNCSVLKLRPDGDVEWRKTYGRGAERAESIQQTDDGGYIVAGWTAYFGTEDSGIWVFKLRPDGAIDPSCDFINETNVSGMDSNAIILDSSASVRDSNANPQDSSATVRDMNVSTNILCASTNVE